MKSDELDHLVEGMERLEQVSLMDLPDDIIIGIFELLDLPNRLKLRVNKRLNELQKAVKNILEEIEINLNDDESEMIVSPIVEYTHPRPLELDQLDLGLRRLTANYSVTRISIGIADFGMNADYDQIIEILFNLEADELCIYPWRGGVFISPHINIPNPLDFALRFRDISITALCDNLTVQDLIKLRKLMIEGNCKLEWFSVDISMDTRISFVKECFGVEIEESATAHGRCTIYNSKDESVELYGKYATSEVYDDLKHFEGGLVTKINVDLTDPICSITFRRCDEKPIEKDRMPPKKKKAVTKELEEAGRTIDSAKCTTEEVVDGLQQLQLSETSKREQKSPHPPIQSIAPIHPVKLDCGLCGASFSYYIFKHFFDPCHINKMRDHGGHISHSSLRYWLNILQLAADRTSRASRDVQQQADSTDHPLNIFKPCRPDASDSIPLATALRRIRAEFNKCGKEKWERHCNKSTSDAWLVCEVCEKDLRRSKDSHLTHFLSRGHEQKMARSGAAVSLPALQHWLRELQLAAD